MKKILLFVSALAGLFIAASCQHENLELVADNTVTFTVLAPGAINTKAIAEGTNVDEVHYAVYKTNATEKHAIGNPDEKPLAQGVVEMSNKKASVKFDLLQDQRYTVIFWAQVAGEDHYTLGDLRTIKVASEVLGNDETRAAFYAKYEFSTETHMDHTVTLVRPFAQLNLLTTRESLKPSQEGQTTGYEIDVKQSEVIVHGLSNTFSTVTGQAPAGEVTFTFKMNATPEEQGQESLKVNGKAYHYVSMNYFFVPEEEKLVDIEYTVKTDKGDIAHNISSVPVKENYRTNVIGNLLTKETTFEILVDADFEDKDYVVDAEDGESYLSVSTAEELLNVAQQIAAGTESSDLQIMLGGDIDLAALPVTRSATASNWTPIGTEEKPFTGVFDGNGYTIKNLALVETEAKEGKAYIGFFGYAKDATIKNVTFENVYINIPCLDIDHSQGHIGAVAGSLEGNSTIENVTVKGDITVYATQTANGASRVAVVAGGNAFGNVTMKNVHVVANEGSSLIANNNTGALAGQLQGKMLFENCSSNIDVTVNKFFAGGLVGLAAGDSKFVNCHTTGDVAVVAGREGRHNDEYRVGGIAGGWADGKTMVCTLENCTYEGNVSGKNADGAVAEPLDYMGYVGRGYTLANCAGSKVVIDGLEFVQKYDNVYGVYTVNGLNPVATADELVASLESKEGVFFMNNIKIEPAKMSNAYGKTGINVYDGQTIDGNGCTLDVKGAGGTWDSGICTSGGLIKNLWVTGSFRGIFVKGANHIEKIVLDNVRVEGTTYTISIDQASGQGLEATNSIFRGWTSYAGTIGNVKFDGCTFGAGNGYNFSRPYAPTEYVNCNFEAGHAIEPLAAVTFENCTFNGVALTAENLSTLVIANIANASVK